MCGWDWGKAPEGSPPLDPHQAQALWHPETPGVTEGVVGLPRQGCWPRMFGTTAGVLGAQGGGSRLLPVVECWRCCVLITKIPSAVAPGPQPVPEAPGAAGFVVAPGDSGQPAAEAPAPRPLCSPPVRFPPGAFCPSRAQAHPDRQPSCGVPPPSVLMQVERHVDHWPPGPGAHVLGGGEGRGAGRQPCSGRSNHSRARDCRSWGQCILPRTRQGRLLLGSSASVHPLLCRPRREGFTPAVPPGPIHADVDREPSLGLSGSPPHRWPRAARSRPPAATSPRPCAGTGCSSSPARAGPR